MKAISLTSLISILMLLNAAKAEDFPTAKNIEVGFPTAKSTLKEIEVAPKPKAVISVTSDSNTIDWFDDFGKAADKANKEDKSILFLFTDPISCIPCKQLESTLQNKEVIKASNNFVCLKVNVNNNNGLELAKKFNVTSWPSLIIYKNNKLVNFRKGFLSKNEVILFLESKPEKVTKPSAKFSNIDLDHTCNKCGTYANVVSKESSNFHSHICPNCKNEWWHENPKKNIISNQPILLLQQSSSNEICSSGT